MQLLIFELFLLDSILMLGKKNAPSELTKDAFIYLKFIL